jgi:protein-disulfide isomerase
MKSQAWNLSVVVSLILLFFTPPSQAQQTSMEELKRQIEALSQSMGVMQKDLQEIKALLQNKVRVTQPQNVVMDIGNHPVRGLNTAKLTLVELSDYECPYCGRYARETVPQIDKEYIQSGKVKYVVMDLPLESMHKNAFKAAEAAGCADEQGKFWEMYNRLFANQQTLDQWKVHAEAVGLDVSKFDECLNSGRKAEHVRSDMVAAQKAGITGTPAFFLAYTDAKSTTIKTVARLVGAQPYVAFKAAIDKLLIDKPEKPKE